MKHYRALRTAGVIQKLPPRVCSVPDCGRKHTGKGYCRLHWERERAGLPLDYVRPVSVATCCERPHYAKGMCAVHYATRWRNTPERVSKGGRRIFFDEARALELLEDGAGYAETAKTLGLKSTTALRKMFPGRGLSKAEAAMVRESKRKLGF